MNNTLTAKLSVNNVGLNSTAIKFIKTRNVKSPSRANPGDAGIDFYIPYAEFDFIDDFVLKNKGHNYALIVTAEYNGNIAKKTFDIDSDINIDEFIEYGIYISKQIIGFFIDTFELDAADSVDDFKITNIDIEIPAHERILVPSGVKVWIGNNASALIATNKSGVATKKGLVVGATTVDSQYTGEVHLSVINTNNYPVNVTCGEKLIQFIHTPVILSEMVEITEDEYNNITSESVRGAGGFGSSGLK